MGKEVAVEEGEDTRGERNEGDIDNSSNIGSTEDIESKGDRDVPRNLWDLPYGPCKLRGGLGVVENKACMLYFFFLVRYERGGGGGGGGVRAQKSKNQKITFRFSVLSTSPLMASVSSLPRKNSQYAREHWSCLFVARVKSRSQR